MGVSDDMHAIERLLVHIPRVAAYLSFPHGVTLVELGALPPIAEAESKGHQTHSVSRGNFEQTHNEGFLNRIDQGPIPHFSRRIVWHFNIQVWTLLTSDARHLLIDLMQCVLLMALTPACLDAEHRVNRIGQHRADQALPAFSTMRKWLEPADRTCFAI